MAELWDAYNKNFNKIENKTLIRGESIPDGAYHLVSEIVVKHTDGSYLEYIEKNMCEGSRVSVQLLAEVGKEQFYIKQGFKLVPHEYCGPALRKIIYKK